MAIWLAKSEPDVFSITDLARDGTTGWEGVRNYQARNYMRAMKLGDRVVFYHSNAEPSGVAGVAEVAREAYPDPTQFDRASEYYDEGSKQVDPRWSTVDLRWVETFPKFIALATLKADPGLAGLEVARKGTRLSVHPVSEEHFARLLVLGRG
jgi:predicted RNA-binding protein with PUA-like domain